MKKGDKMTEETKKKMSESRKGAKHWNFGGGQTNSGKTHFKKGLTPWNKGKKGLFVPKTKGIDNRKSYECVMCFTRFKSYKKRTFCSRKCSALQHSSENNSNWIGGGWLYVRKLILIDQDYTCQDCGHREPDIMEVNHKLERSNYPELAHDKNNLEVLCPNCHRRKTNRFLKNKSLKQ